MRFCLVSTQPDWGGGEKLLWSMRCALVEAGHSVSWVVRRDNPLAERVATTSDRLLATTKRRGFHPRDWLSVRSALVKEQPDVLLMNDSHAIMLGGSAALSLLRRRPLRLAIRHTIFPLHSPLKLKSMSDMVICVSEAARRVVIEGGIPANRCTVIYGGCEPITLEEGARERISSELRLASNTPLIVCVGNLLECKGHESLIEAAAGLQASHPDAVILIAGEGPLRETLERRIGELKLTNVRLLGFRTDADSLLSAADIVVHPSLQEGLSLVMIQAQMLRKRIVSTCVGGSAEVLGVDDQDGCPVWRSNAGDSADLTQQLRSSIEHLRAPMPPEFAERLERAAARAQNRFDIGRNVAGLVDLAENLREQARKKSA